jgi:hypothetical protein
MEGKPLPGVDVLKLKQSGTPLFAAQQMICESVADVSA